MKQILLVLSLISIGFINACKSSHTTKVNKKIINPLDTIKLPDLIPYRAKNGLWGYADTALNIKIPCKYRKTTFFNNNRAAVVRAEDGMKAYINKKGELMTDFIYYAALPYKDGIATVALPGSSYYGAIDTLGKVVIPFIYDKVIQRKGHKVIAVELEDKVGNYDLNGNLVMLPVYDNLTPSLYRSDAPVRAKFNGKHGYVTELNKVVIPFEYDDADSFEFGRACVVKDSLWMIIDTKGNVLKTFPEYDWVGSAFAGKNRYTIMKITDKREGGWFNNYIKVCGLINRNFEEVVACKYTSIGVFHHGYATFSLRRGTKEYYGVMDSLGNEIIPPIYGMILPSLSQEESGDKYYVASFGGITRNRKPDGIINLKNEILVPFEYNHIVKFRDDTPNLFIATKEKGGKYGIINQYGEIILPFKYYKIWRHRQGIAKVELSEDGPEAYIDVFGREYFER